VNAVQWDWFNNLWWKSGIWHWTTSVNGEMPFPQEYKSGQKDEWVITLFQVKLMFSVNFQHLVFLTGQQKATPTYKNMCHLMPKVFL